MCEQIIKYIENSRDYFETDLFPVIRFLNKFNPYEKTHSIFLVPAIEFNSRLFSGFKYKKKNISS